MNDSKKHAILAPLPQHQGAGVPLNFDATYDAIKEARLEDDTRLSKGIWQSKPKLADWARVASLCESALSKSSKDLQIIGWLLEAYVVQFGFKGGIHGARLLQEFCTSFWSVLYPNALTVHMENTSFEDDKAIFQNGNLNLNISEESAYVQEKRQNILDWIDKTLANRILFLELAPAADAMDLQPLTFAMWIDAKDADKRQRLFANSINSSKDQKPKLDVLRKSLAVAPIDGLLGLREDIRAYLDAIDALCQIFLKCDLERKIQFTEVTSRLYEILTLTDDVLAKRNANPREDTEPEYSEILPYDNFHQAAVEPLEIHENENNVEVVAKREDAYKAIKKLGEFLMEIDPHSPAPYLLDLIVSWQDKNLLQIITDIQNGNPESQALLKILSGTINEKK